MDDHRLLSNHNNIELSVSMAEDHIFVDQRGPGMIGGNTTMLLKPEDVEPMVIALLEWLEEYNG